MVEVRYTRRGSAHELSVKGHAGYAQPGSDIVCAGVSAVTYALLAYLEKHEGETRELVTNVREGDVEVTCEGDVKISTAFDMAAEGYRAIAAMYPEYVRIHRAANGG